MDATKKLIKPKTAAEMLGINPATLAKMRRAGEGPAYYKVAPRSYRYSEDDVLKYIEQQKEGK